MAEYLKTLENAQNKMKVKAFLVCVFSCVFDFTTPRAHQAMCI